METFSALLAFCAGIHRSPRSFDVSFDLRLNKRMSKQWWGWWFETPSRPLWRHCTGVNLATLSTLVSRLVTSWFVWLPPPYEAEKTTKKLHAGQSQPRDNEVWLVLFFSKWPAISQREIAIIPLSTLSWWPVWLTWINLKNPHMDK